MTDALYSDLGDELRFPQNQLVNCWKKCSEEYILQRFPSLVAKECQGNLLKTQFPRSHSRPIVLDILEPVIQAF